MTWYSVEGPEPIFPNKVQLQELVQMASGGSLIHFHPEWHLDKTHVFILTLFRRLCGNGCGGIFLDKTFAALSTRGRVWAAA